LSRLVASAEPAVTLASLAEACVPLLADECVINVLDDEGAAFQLRRPLPPPAGDNSRAGGEHRVSETAGIAPYRAESVTVILREEDCADEPGYTADVTFRWHHLHPEAGIGDSDRVIADLLAERAAHLVRQERLVAALLRETDRSQNLTEALASNRHIGQALGILMCTYKLTSEQAFNLLRGVSQHTHRKLRDVADEVNLTGTLIVATPSAPAPPSSPRINGGDRG
jgi:hypothetical protein